MPTPTDTSHRALITEFIQKRETDDLKFYERTAALNYWAWHFTAGIAFVSSVGAALLAALIKDSYFATSGRSLLIVVSVMGAGATGVLHLYKFREKEALREEGRIELEDILANARSALASITTENDAKVSYHALRERYRQLELSQHRRDIALRSDEVPRFGPR